MQTTETSKASRPDLWENGGANSDGLRDWQGDALGEDFESDIPNCGNDSISSVSEDTSGEDSDERDECFFAVRSMTNKEPQTERDAVLSRSKTLSLKTKFVQAN